jgi:hypothetical protein
VHRVAEGFGVFAPGDESLQSVDDKLAVQNGQALRLHEQTGRPLLTLVYATFVAIGETSDNTEQRLELAGMLAAQAEQNDLGSSGGGSEPLLRFLVANGGTDMRQHPRMAELIARVADHDPTFAGVVGLDKSSQNTKDLIRNSGSAGFPVLSATLSADGLGQGATNYFQMAPSNSEQAAAIRTFADRRVKDVRSKGKPASKQVTIICPNDSSSLYSQTLMQGLLRRFGSGGWTVNVHAFTPAIPDPGPAGDPTPCGDDPVPITSLREDAEALSAAPAGGLVVFAGRSTDFQLFVQGAGSRLQIIADDDVSSIVARRNNNRLIDGRSFRYVSFAYGGKDQSHQQPYSYIHTDLGGLVGIDAQVDGHAAGAYEAIQAYLRVGRDILARGQQINPALLIGQFPAETVPGNDTGASPPVPPPEPPARSASCGSAAT